MTTYTTTILQTGANTTGIEVPPEVLAELGGGKRPAVVVTLHGTSFRLTLGGMGGKTMIPLSAENRALTGAKGGETLEVTIALDTEPRVVALPDDLARALEAAGARAAFDKLAPSARKAHVTAVAGAKAAETRARRIAKIVEGLAPA